MVLSTQLKYLAQEHPIGLHSKTLSAGHNYLVGDASPKWGTGLGSGSEERDAKSFEGHPKKQHKQWGCRNGE